MVQRRSPTNRGVHPALWGVPVALAVIGLWQIWNLVVPRRGVCAAIYPPPAGCGGEARLVVAAAWTAVIVAALVATLTLGRTRRRWAMLGTAWVTLAALAGWFATHVVRPFVFF